MTATPHLPRLTRLTSDPRRRALAALAVAVIVLALSIALGLRALHGSSSSSAPSAGSSAGEAGRSAVAQGGVPGADAPADATSGAKAPAADPGAAQGNGLTGTGTVVESKIARSAWLGIKVGDLTESAARARVIATDAGGQVTSENVVTAVDPTGGPTGPGGVDPQLGSGTSVPDVGVDEARMVLSVPAKALDDVLTQLSKIGSVSYRSSQSQDVTDSYIDTKARIQPMRDGIDRVRALLAKTTDLQQVITLESELSRRQADLDSLEQRHRHALDRRDHAGADRGRDRGWPAHGVGQPPRLPHGHPHRARRAPAVARPARAAHPAGPAGPAPSQRRYAVRDLPHGRRPFGSPLAPTRCGDSERVLTRRSRGLSL